MHGDTELVEVSHKFGVVDKSGGQLKLVSETLIWGGDYDVTNNDNVILLLTKKLLE